MPHFKLPYANFRVFLDSRQGGRKYMEDVVMIREHKSENGEEDFVFWGVFDGHGGAEAAKFAREHLLDELKKIKGFWSTDTEQVTRAIKEAFVNTHKLMWKNVGNWPRTVSGLPSTAGTTASIAFIKNKKLYIAHVGDSSVVVGWEKATWQRYIANLVTVDHKPEDPVERKRIEESGGLVMNKAGVQRVVWHRPKPTHKGPVRRSTHIDDIPFLAVARALGDLWSYNSQRDTFVVSPEPDVTVMDFDPKKHKCIVLASDGLWNMVKPEQAVALVEEMDESEAHLFNLGYNPARKLVTLALDRWGMRHMRADNTSVILALIDLPGVDPSPGAHTNDRQYSNTSNSTVLLSDSDSEPANGASPYGSCKSAYKSWNLVPSPQHIGFGRPVMTKRTHAHVVHGKTPKQHKLKNVLLKTPKSAPSKLHSSTSVKIAKTTGSPACGGSFTCQNGASPLLAPSKRKASNGSPEIAGANGICPIQPLTASPVKRKASEDCCPSSAKKLRRSSPSKSDIIPISNLSAEGDISQEVVVSTSEEDDAVFQKVPESSRVELDGKTGSPKEATSAKSPLKIDTNQGSPSMALVSPIWPSCLEKDINLDASSTDDICNFPPVSSSTSMCSSVLRENSPKSMVKTSVILHRKTNYAKLSKRLTGSQNQAGKSVLRRKSPSQGKKRVHVHKLRIRTKRPLKLRNSIHRTRLQAKATGLSTRKS